MRDHADLARRNPLPLQCIASIRPLVDDDRSAVCGDAPVKSAGRPQKMWANETSIDRVKRNSACNARSAYRLEEADHTAVLVHDGFFVLHVNDVRAASDDGCCGVASPIRVAPPGPRYPRIQLSIDIDAILRDDFDGCVGGCTLYGKSKLARVVSNAARRRWIGREIGDLHVMRCDEESFGARFNTSAGTSGNRAECSGQSWSLGGRIPTGRYLAKYAQNWAVWTTARSSDVLSVLGQKTLQLPQGATSTRRPVRCML